MVAAYSIEERLQPARSDCLGGSIADALTTPLRALIFVTVQVPPSFADQSAGFRLGKVHSGAKRDFAACLQTLLLRNKVVSAFDICTSGIRHWDKRRQTRGLDIISHEVKPAAG